MAKPVSRTYSRYTLQATALLGKLVRLARIERKMTAQEVADRAGISRGLLQRIEKGDPKCELGAAFEVAAILGVALFADDGESLAVHVRHLDDKLTLLPKAVRTAPLVADDDF